MCGEVEPPAASDAVDLCAAASAEEPWLREWRGRPLEPEDADRLLASLAIRAPSSN